MCEPRANGATMVANVKLYTALVAPWICCVCAMPVQCVAETVRETEETRRDADRRCVHIHHATEIVMKERR